MFAQSNLTNGISSVDEQPAFMGTSSVSCNTLILAHSTSRRQSTAKSPGCIDRPAGRPAGRGLGTGTRRPCTILQLVSRRRQTKMELTQTRRSLRKGVDAVYIPCSRQRCAREDRCFASDANHVTIEDGRSTSSRTRSSIWSRDRTERGRHHRTAHAAIYIYIYIYTYSYSVES